MTCRTLQPVRGDESVKSASGGLSIPATVAVVLFLVKLASPFNSDPDLWWHLKTGEYIVTERVLPYADIFSYTAYGKDWVLHEWLSEVIFYAVTSLGGLNALSVFVAFLYALTFCVLLRVTATVLEDTVKALLVTLFLFAPVMAFAAPRPQIFTYLFFAVFMWVLFEFKYRGRTRQLMVLPLVMLAWPNLHGAFVAGMALLAMFVACEWIIHAFAEKKDEAKREALKKLTVVFCIALVATLANPRFIGYWLYPFQVVTMSVAKGWIAEWHSPDFHNPYYRYLLAAFICYFFVLVYSRRKPDLTELLLPVFFIAAGFTAVRHLPLACIVSVPFFALFGRALPWRNMPHFVAVRGIALWRSGSRPLDARVVTTLNVALLCIVTAAVVYGKYRGSDADAVPAELPVKAADFVLDNDIRGRIFNDYGDGGYLIYRLFPEQKVFIDGRADMYGDEFVKEYIAITHATTQWKAKFEKFGIDYALLQNDSPLRQLLLADRSFRLVYVDRRYSVLVRDIPKFAHLRDVAGRPSAPRAFSEPIFDIGPGDAP